MNLNRIRHSNRTIVSVSKIAYAVFYWRSGEYERFLKPKLPTVHGCEIEPNEFAAYHTDYPQETLVERARRLDLLDSQWVPVFKLILNNGHTLEYTGKKALSLKEKYSSQQFGKQ